MAATKYEIGSIVRVKLHQFLTYQDVEFHPGPRLNVVMGPNGTGKSSIVCAIAIGLGAAPRVLGRADTLTEFILTGKDGATTEIELVKDEHGGTYTISRHITRSQRGTSKWKIDGKSATEPDVRKLVEEELNIQIANLCTFLPQEKVGEFSAFDSIALLRETEKALGGQQLLDEHEKIVDFEKTMHDAGRTARSAVEELEEVEKQKRNLEPDKEKLERRQAHVEKAELCGKRVKWVKFEEKKAEALDAKERKQAAVDAFRKANEAVEPLRVAAQDARSDQQKAEARYKKRQEDAKAGFDAARACETKVDKAKERLEELQDANENAGQRAKKLDTKLAQARKAQLAADAKLANTGGCDVDGLKKAIEKLRPKSDAARAKERAAQDAAQDAQHALSGPQRALSDAAAALNAVGDGDRRRSQAYERGGGAASQCVKLRSWLDDHAGNFRKPVLGPVALEIQVDSDEARAILEVAAGQWTFHSFVCQTKTDYDKLAKFIGGDNKRHFSGVNLGFVENGKGSATSTFDAKCLASLKKLGGKGTLLDYVKGPPAVVDHLIAHASIQNVLVGGPELEQAFNASKLDGLLGKNFLCYCASRAGQGFALARLQGTQSRYGNKDTTVAVTRTRSRNPPILPSVAADDPAAAEALERKKADAERAVEDATQAWQAATRDAERAAAEYTKASKDIVVKSKELSDYKKLQGAARAAKAGVDRAEEDVKKHERDVEKETARNQKLLEAALAKVCEAMAASAKTNAEMMACTVTIAPAMAAKEAAKERKARADRAVKEEEEQTKTFEAAAKRAAEEFNKLKEETRALKQVAEHEAPLTDELRAQLEELPDSSDQLEEIIRAENEQAAQIHDDPELLKRYQHLTREYDRLKARVDNMESEAQSQQDAMDALRAPWEKTLTDALADLKVKFADYMGTLSARGDVDIERADTVAKWGLVIKVAFRDSAELQPLAAHVQSGGERSVSTIMFLMALQAHMPSPFRVVDEINQGMDEVNERIVFKRIVLNSTGPTAPQYFLITPKLLQGLYDMEHEDVRALVVYNGSYNLKRPKDWDLPDFLAKKRKMLAEAN